MAEMGMGSPTMLLFNFSVVCNAHAKKYTWKLRLPSGSNKGTILLAFSGSIWPALH